MKQVLLVFVGGGIGSVIRYLIGSFFSSSSTEFPWGTFSVNRPLKEIEDWNFYTSIMTPTHMKQFINDELLIDSESTGNLARRNSFDRFWLGQRGGGHYWNGEIGSVIVYEKALTNQEVLQNYNALKSRFIS